MDSTKSKITVSATSLVVIAILIVAAAFVAKSVLNKRINRLHRQATQPAHKNSLLIMCAGDGQTLGIGTPKGNDYPNILETLLGLVYPEMKIKVANIAKPGNNSAGTLADLYRQVPTLKPDIVILTTGSNNFWNYDGYTAPLTSKTGIFKVPATLIEKSWPAKLFRLIRQKIKQKHYMLAPSGNLSTPKYEQTQHLRIMQIKDRGQKAAAYLEFAKYFDDAGLTGKALRFYHKSYQIAPSLEAILGIGLAHRRQQEPFLAYNWIERAAKDYPSRPDHFVAMAQYYFLNYDFENALAWTEKTLERFPKNYESHVMRGKCFRIMQMPDKAEAEFKKAIENFPEKAPAIAEYALIWADRQDYFKALELTLEAVEKDPEEPELYARAGHLSTLCDNPEQAADWFEKGIQKFPEHYENYKGIGLILLKLGKYKPAAEYLHKALMFHPSDRGTYGALSQCLKNLEEGPKIMQRLKNNPELGLGKRYPAIQKEIVIGNWLSTDLEAAIKLCRAHGALPVLLGYPDTTPANKFMQRTAQRCNTMYIDTVNLKHTTAHTGPKPPFAQNTQAAANSKIAAKILDRLQKKRYLPGVL